MPLSRRGVTSLAKSGSTKIRGDATLSEGTNVTLTESGQDISVAVPNSTTIYKTGVDTSRSMNDPSGIQNIPHGLGKVPKYVRISAIAIPNALTSFASSLGTYDGVNTGNYYYSLDLATPGVHTQSADPGTVVYLEDTTPNITAFATISVDSTNIILNWFQSGTSVTNFTIFLTWEAEG